MDWKNLSKKQTIILFMIFIAIGGIILYGKNTTNNFSPLDYVFK
jgi:hypothetical protein